MNTLKTECPKIAQALIGIFSPFQKINRTGHFLIAMLLVSWMAGSAAYGFDQVTYVSYWGLVMSAVCIVVGIFIVFLMVNLFSNSSPFSQSFGEFFAFGSVKWDDFAGFLIVGALMAGWGICTLVSQTTRAIEYQAANESVIKTAKEKAAHSHATAPKKMKSKAEKSVITGKHKKSV